MQRSRLSIREGIRAPIYEVNQDCYRGEWTNDRRHGEKKNELKLLIPYYKYVIQVWLSLQVKAFLKGNYQEQDMMESGRRMSGVDLVCSVKRIRQESSKKYIPDIGNTIEDM